MQDRLHVIRPVLQVGCILDGPGYAVGAFFVPISRSAPAAFGGNLLKPIPPGQFNQAEFDRAIENRCGKIK